MPQDSNELTRTTHARVSLSQLSRRLRIIEPIARYIQSDTDLESILRSENLPFALDALRASESNREETN